MAAARSAAACPAGSAGPVRAVAGSPSYNRGAARRLGFMRASLMVGGAVVVLLVGFGFGWIVAATGGGREADPASLTDLERGFRGTDAERRSRGLLHHRGSGAPGRQPGALRNRARDQARRRRGPLALRRAPRLRQRGRHPAGGRADRLGRRHADGRHHRLRDPGAGGRVRRPRRVLRRALRRHLGPRPVRRADVRHDPARWTELPGSPRPVARARGGSRSTVHVGCRSSITFACGRGTAASAGGARPW